MEVVGVVRTVDDLGGVGNAEFIAPPALLPSVRGEVDEFGSFVGVVLEGGVDPASFVTVLRSVDGFEDVEAEVRREVLGGERETAEALGTDLTVVGALAGAASTLVLGQAVARHVALGRDRETTLHALGMHRRARRVARTAGVAPAALAGALLGGLGAFLTSSAMPIGLARRAEPDPGLAVDWPVLLGGSLGFFLLVLAVATSCRHGRRQCGREAPQAAFRAAPPQGPSQQSVTTFAQGGGRPALPVRSSLVALSVGLAGCLTAAAFAASTDGPLSSPDRWGHRWDLLLNFTSDNVDDGAERIVEDERFAAAARLDGGVTVMDGEVVTAFGMSPLAGEMTYALRSGRQPVGTREAVVGVSMADEHDIDPGDTLVLGVGDRGQEVMVVGTALFPDLNGERDFDDAIGLDRPGFAAVADVQEQFNANQVVVRLREQDRDLTDEEVDRDYPGSIAGPESRPSPPEVVSNIKIVRPLAVWSGLFLALLAAGSLAHVLALTVRTRRADLATLRSMGFTRRHLRLSIAAQAGILTMLALPLSLAVGVASSAAVWGFVAAPAHAQSSSSDPSVRGRSSVSVRCWSPRSSRSRRPGLPPDATPEPADLANDEAAPDVRVALPYSPTHGAQGRWWPS